MSREMMIQRIDKFDSHREQSIAIKKLYNSQTVETEIRQELLKVFSGLIDWSNSEEKNFPRL